MNDFVKTEDLIREKLNNVKSEEDFKVLYNELKPQIDELTKRYFSKKISTSDKKENDINWIDELIEYITNTIQLYLIYHVKGELEKICLTLSEKNPPSIILIIGEQDYAIEYNVV